MKINPSRHLLLIVFSALVFNGCKERTHAAPPDQTGPNTVPAPSAIKPRVTVGERIHGAATDIRASLAEAWEKSREATYAQRAAVRERMAAAERSLDATIEQWSAKKDSVVEDMRPSVDAALTELRNARAVLDQKIEALGNASEETWNSVKAELNTAWQRVNTAIADLTAKLDS